MVSKNKIMKHYGEITVPIVGFFWILMIAVSMFSRPTFTIVNHVVVFNQGVIAPALLMGTIFWAIIELFTPPGTKLLHLLVRSFVGFLFGIIIGGFMGYEFNFGQYVLQAALSGGNGPALYYLVSIFIFGCVIVADASWAHRKAFVKGAVSAYKKIGSRKRAYGFIPLALVHPMSTSSSTVSGMTIFNQIWSALYTYLIIPIMQGAGNMFTGIFSGFTLGLDEMFAQWGFSLGTYGIWGPLMVVISISFALMIGYLIFDVIGIERDVLGGEEAV